MQLFDKLQPYWPVLAASLGFLLLGLSWRVYAARAMERSPKPLAWVRRYRTGGFPFRKELMGSPKPRPWALWTVLAGAGALALSRRISQGILSSGRAGAMFAGGGWLLPLGLSLLGGAAVYGLLTLLFDSPWVSIPGALLFSASAVRERGESALLALCLLLLLLYLQTDRIDFPAELLYLASVLSITLGVAAQPALLWILPCLPPVHWYKLDDRLRGGQSTLLRLVLALAVALAIWGLGVSLSALLHPLLGKGELIPRFSFSRLGRELNQLALDALASFSFPTLSGTLDLLLQAPMLGCGLWGCGSAWILARERRDVRGWFILTVLAATVPLWLVTWSCLPILGLTLSTACVLRDADLGRRRLSAAGMILLGVAWYYFIQIAAWAIPLSGTLQERLK